MVVSYEKCRSQYYEWTNPIDIRISSCFEMLFCHFFKTEISNILCELGKHIKTLKRTCWCLSAF